MKLTSQMIKDYAKQIGIDDIGICPIDRFSEAPPLMNPKNIFPEAKSVIVVLQRITRGSYRGIEEGTCWSNYTFYSYGRLNSYFRPRLTYRLACFIEDFGWEAAPHYPGVSERQPYMEPVEPGRLPPNVVPSIRYLAVGAGLGEIGWSKVFLSKKFGPRCRMDCILTDAELEYDEMVEPGSICIKCGACVRECPGQAIPPVNSGKTVSVNIGGKKIEFGDVHMGRCTFTHHGLNSRISPFLKKDFPNFEFDVCSSDATEVEAYKLCCALRNHNWFQTPFMPTGKSVAQYPHVMRISGGYHAICGARGCIRACMNVLEKANKIENVFDMPFQHKKPWPMMDYKRTEKYGEVNPWWEDYIKEKGYE